MSKLERIVSGAAVLSLAGEFVSGTACAVLFCYTAFRFIDGPDLGPVPADPLLALEYRFEDGLYWLGTANYALIAAATGLGSGLLHKINDYLSKNNSEIGL